MSIRVERLADNLEGINRRRQKGGASKNDLIDLLNGYRTPKGTVNSRPGTTWQFQGPSNTKGMLGFAEKIHVFSHATQSHSVPNLVVNVLKHPSGGGATIAKITSAFPFLGRIYVVAKFTDNVVQHYWLEDPPAWQASAVYGPGPFSDTSTVQPTTPNGLYFDINNFRDDVIWAPNTEKEVGDAVQPTTYNGMVAFVTSASGVPIKTGGTEPVWPAPGLVSSGFGSAIDRRWLSDPDVNPPAPTPATPPATTPGGGGPSGGAGNYKPFPPREFVIEP